MAEGIELRRRLRNRLTDFIETTLPELHFAAGFLREIRTHRWRAAIVGGLLRELIVGNRVPRDLDIVVVDDDMDDVIRILSTKRIYRNRFGGLHFEVHGWPVDLWSVGSTWAIKSHGIAPTFENLVKHAFLNIDAIAVQFSGLSDELMPIFEHGFFDAISTRILDVNFEPNPFPTRAALKSLFLCWHLKLHGFRASHMLAQYILVHCRHIDQVLSLQRQYYGKPFLSARSLEQVVLRINQQLATNSPLEGIDLFPDEQLPLLDV